MPNTAALRSAGCSGYLAALSHALLHGGASVHLQADEQISCLGLCPEPWLLRLQGCPWALIAMQEFAHISCPVLRSAIGKPKERTVVMRLKGVSPESCCQGPWHNAACQRPRAALGVAAGGSQRRGGQAQLPLQSGCHASRTAAAAAHRQLQHLQGRVGTGPGLATRCPLLQHACSISSSQDQWCLYSAAGLMWRCC